MWSSTPLGEYVRALVAQGKLRSALLQYTDTIDDAGNIVREVLGGVFALPTDPPPAPGGLDAGGAEPAAELLGLAARIYTAEPHERAALADPSNRAGCRPRRHAEVAQVAGSVGTAPIASCVCRGCPRCSISSRAPKALSI